MNHFVHLSSRALLAGLLATVVVLGTCTGAGTPCASLAASPQARADWLGKQGAAMVPDQLEALTQFELAPRYTISATLDLDQAAIHGQLDLEYTHLESVPLDGLQLRLWPNAGTIYGGGAMSVDWISRQGEAVDWFLEADPTILKLALTPALISGETTTISIAFRATIPRSGAKGYHIFHTADAVTSLAGWYPVLAVRDGGAWNAPPVPKVGDANLADIGLYEVHLRVPDGYLAIATGKEVGRYQDTAGIVWQWVSGPVRSFAVVVGDRYQHESAMVDDVAINLYTLAEARANITTDTALDMAVDIFQTFEDIFGPYPHAELDVVETLVSIGGYEFSDLVVIEHDARQRGSYSYYRWLLAHEIAHQWWYALVGNDSVADPWLDESMASYAVVLYVERASGPAAAQALLDSYRQSAGSLDSESAPITSSALDFYGWASYREPVYYHGAMFLAALRKELGDEAFFDLLWRYQQAFRYRQATTSDFLQMARESTESDLDPLMLRWFGAYAPTRVGGPLP